MTTIASTRSGLARLSSLLCMLAVVCLVWASAGHHHPAQAMTGTASQEKACTVCAVFAGMESPEPAGTWSHPTALVCRTPAEAAQHSCAPAALVTEGRAPPSA